MVLAPQPIPTESEVTDVHKLAELCKALADPARLRIMLYLATTAKGGCCSEAGICACDLEAVAGLSQPTVSYHMKCLTQAGLVTADKRGKWMYYSVNPSGFFPLKEVLPLLMN
jgi:ArsR family transcriptional regulator, arsenate/arsenite/antimonite-responsive transcriptional repressor